MFPIPHLVRHSVSFTGLFRHGGGLGGQPDPQDASPVKVPLSPGMVHLAPVCLCAPSTLQSEVCPSGSTSAGGPYKALHQDTRWNLTPENGQVHGQDGFACPENSSGHFNLGHNKVICGGEGAPVPCDAASPCCYGCVLCMWNTALRNVGIFRPYCPLEDEEHQRFSASFTILSCAFAWE